MATGGTPRSLEEIVECDICMEIMSQPQALCCLHHFCRKCTNKLDRVHEEQRVGVSCPKCRKFTREDTIQASYMMNQLLEIHDRKHKKDVTESCRGKTCVQCDFTDVKGYCKDCQIYLCEACKDRHLRIPSLRNHSIVTDIDVEERVEAKYIFCSKHPHCTVKYNCVPCHLAMCAECKIESHDLHESQSIEKAVEEIIGQANDKMQAIEKLNASFKERIHQLSKYKKTQDDKRENAIKLVDSQKTAIMKKLDEDYEKLVAEIEVCTSTKQIDLMICDDESILAEQESILSWTNTIMNMTKGTAPLHELQGGLYQRLDAVSTRKPESLVDVQNIVQSQFTFQAYTLQAGNLLGKIHSENSRIKNAKTTFQRSAKGPVSISECAADGSFVCLENTGRKEELLGNWRIVRIIDGFEGANIVLDPNFRNRAGGKIKLFANLKPLNAGPYDIEVEVHSWGVGANITTKLVNANGEDRATHVQKTIYSERKYDI